jgi:hypothetical protein
MKGGFRADSEQIRVEFGENEERIRKGFEVDSGNIRKLFPELLVQESFVKVTSPGTFKEDSGNIVHTQGTLREHSSSSFNYILI